MTVPSTNLCYGPENRSYAPGGQIRVPQSGNMLTANGGTVITLGVESALLNGGSGGQAARWRCYQDGAYVQDGPQVLIQSNAQQTTYTLPGTGSHTYFFQIWTDSNAYGVTFTSLWATHAVCTGSTVPCVPQLKAGQDTQVFVTDALLNTLVGIATGGGAVRSLMGYTIGSVISIESLCTMAPPTVPTLDASFWGTPDHMAWYGGVYLRALAWWYFCECTSGTGPSLPPPPVIVDPPNRPDDPVYTPNPTNPCLDLTEVRRKLDQLLAITKSDLDLDTILQRYQAPFATIPGAVHSLLGGAGTFAISRLVGLRIEAADTSPEGELEGTPPYKWNLGWVSVSDGGGMLQELRITRSSQDWFPKQCQLATLFGYYCKPGVTITVTELQAEPP